MEPQTESTNSVNGEEEKLNTILPLCKKYGAAVVGLAIDERGILPKAEDRVAIARRIRNAALAAGIPQEDIYIDCLTLTASAQQEDVLATVQALHACTDQKEHLPELSKLRANRGFAFIHQGRKLTGREL